jgi:radical SAM superfamily enzyme
MNIEEAKKLPKPKVHPMVGSLPNFLKDTKNYNKIQKAILDAGATKHSHAEVLDWAGCTHCQNKQKDRLQMMRKLGFQSAAQYMTWKKIHEEIKNRYPLVDWSNK